MPKQYLSLGSRSVLATTIDCFLNHPGIDLIQPVIHEDDFELFEASTVTAERLMPPVTGGSTRQSSVRSGLEALVDKDVDLVMIHDGARPFASSDLLDRLLATMADHDGALAALPVSDTLRLSTVDHLADRTISRENLWSAQTPQCFRYDRVLAAHRDAPHDNFTDDVAVAENAGMQIKLVPGDPGNFKITSQSDLDLANAIVAAAEGSHMETRTGYGFDVHRFEPGKNVRLCGIDLPFNQKLKGHSDADVALHALTDAMLGAIGAGDIGEHFPPSDDTWENADSARFVAFAMSEIEKRNGKVTSLDITIICEKPKVGPHRKAMRERIAEITGVETNRINVKATTTEKLGFTGRGEGIAAQALATIQTPASN